MKKIIFKNNGLTHIDTLIKAFNNSDATDGNILKLQRAIENSFLNSTNIDYSTTGFHIMNHTDMTNCEILFEEQKQEVTKDQFERYVRLQMSGKINMHNIVQGAKISGLSEETYEEIMWNYNELDSKFS